MPLTLPDTGDLADFMGLEDVDNDDYAEIAIQQAADLLSIATDVTDDPTDELRARTVKNGILSMAQFLVVRQPNASAIYSPFQSENLGSYSYSKTVEQASAGRATGVMWFDLAVRVLNGDTTAVTTSRNFFSDDDALRVPAGVDPSLFPTMIRYVPDSRGRVYEDHPGVPDGAFFVDESGM